MSKLTDEQIEAIYKQETGALIDDSPWALLDFSRSIESAATEPLLQRIAELEANEKVLLAQVQGHTKWREKIVKASEQAYGENAIRYKFSLTKSGKVMNTFPKEIDGRWFALVPAEDDGHIGHIARIAELEQRNSDLHEDVQRFKKHALNEKAARIELERQLEEARKDAERLNWLAFNPVEALDLFGHVTGDFSSWPKWIRADIDAAMQKGQR